MFSQASSGTASGLGEMAAQHVEVCVSGTPPDSPVVSDCTHVRYLIS